MAHNLTEGNTFANNGTLQVPEGTDDHHNLSSYIEFIAQTLADRSQYLKIRADGAAQLAGNNSFTGSNSFPGGISGDIDISGGLDVNGDTTLGADGTGNLQVNGTIGSTGNATVGTDGSGNLQVNGTAGITGVAAVGSLVSSASVQAASSGRFLYGSSGLAGRTKRLNLAAGVATSLLQYFGAPGWAKSATSTIQYLHVPILLPHGAVLTAVTMLVKQTTAPIVFNLFRIAQSSWLGGTDNTSANVGSSNLSSSDTTGVAVAVPITGLGAGYTIDNVNNEYHLRAEWDNTTGTADAFIAAILTFTDPGPRND